MSAPPTSRHPHHRHPVRQIEPVRRAVRRGHIAVPRLVVARRRAGCGDGAADMNRRRAGLRPGGLAASVKGVAEADDEAGDAAQAVAVGRAGRGAGALEVKYT